MEILTTIIKFRCQKKTMAGQTQNAQMFCFKSATGLIKIFVPKSKILVKDDDSADDYNLCMMPKWAFMRTKNLAEHVEIIEETQHMEIVNDI